MESILDASTSSEAYGRTAVLIDEALPGGSAPADDAAQLVQVILKAPELATDRYRSCLLWILVLLRRWTGVYRVASEAGRAISDVVLTQEAETLASLEKAAAAVRSIVPDEDPEVRSMVYRLLGSADASPEVMDLLRRMTTADSNELARACAAEAATVAAIRFWPTLDPAFLTWLRSLLVDGDATILGRLAHVRNGRALIKSEALAEKVLQVGQIQLPEEGPFWPVELI